MTPERPARGLRRTVLLASAAAMLLLAAAIITVAFLGVYRLGSNTFQEIGVLHEKLFGMARSAAKTYWQEAAIQSSREMAHDIDTLTRGLEVSAVSLGALERFSGDRALTQKIIAHFGKNHPIVYSLMYAWEDGQFVFANREGPTAGYDPRRREWYRQAMAAFPHPHWTPIYEDYDSRANIISLALAFKDADGSPAGALCMDLRLEEITRLATQHSVNGRTVFLLDESGSFILPRILPSGETLQKRAFREVFANSAALPAALNALNANASGAWELTAKDTPFLIALSAAAVSNWKVGVALPMEMVNQSIEAMSNETDTSFHQLENQVSRWGVRLAGGVLVLSLLIAASALWFLRCSLTRAVRPLEELTQSVMAIGDGDLSIRQPAAGAEEIRTLSRAFNEMLERLNRHIVLLQEETARTSRLDRELQLARDIQLGLLPADFPGADAPYDIYAVMRPARIVGGDFYDFVRQGDNLYFAVADVAGKGIAAGLFLSVVKTLFRSLLHEALPPEIILQRMNEQLTAQNPQKMFVTLFIGQVRLAENVLRYASAGHCPPYYSAAGEAFAPLSCPKSLPLGIVSPLAYEAAHVQMTPASRCFVYTDGVTEAMDSAGGLFGVERLEGALRQAGDDTPRATLDGVMAALEAHMGTAGVPDDITMLLLEIKPSVQG